MALIDFPSLARLSRWMRLLPAIAVLLLGALHGLIEAAVPTAPGGPILVVTAGSTKYKDFYPEILRAEGLNAYATADVAQLNAATLSAYDVVVLAPVALNSTQVTALTDWVNAGGSLIALAPDAQLNTLLGVAPAAGGAVVNGYILVNTSGAPGNGIVNQTMQIHANANRYTLNGATSVATLYTNATTATTGPAVTLRTVGSGRAAAFAYDLVTSIVLTRQGNPAWAGDERDAQQPIRSDDLYFGNKAGDVQPDWVNLGKVAIPQADEQQRLLANLMTHMSQARKPLPRFWYFPRGEKAVVIMTGDDHANGGTGPRFDQFIARSPAGCSVDNWECVRGTSYVYSNTIFQGSTPQNNVQRALNFQSQGFEVGLHINTGCSDYGTPPQAQSLPDTYDQQAAEFASAFPGVNAPSTQRHHCIVWSDWATGAKVQLDHGMRLDTDYYYWPPSWANNVPGVFSGSAMPMRFADNDTAGSLIDVFQAVSQMTDESGQAYPFTIDTLLDRAIGPEEYYGAYTVNAHTDSAQNPVADAVLDSALARGVPIVSARQMLTWLDGRQSSSFGGFAWNGSTLNFSITPGPGAVGLQAMLPTRFNGQALGTVTRGGANVSYTVRSVKGVEYAFFDAVSGTYGATYGVDNGAPTVSSTLPNAGVTNVAPDVVVTATFSEAMDANTINGSTFELHSGTSTGPLVAGTVSYNSGTRTASLQPSSPLLAGTAYTAVVRGGATDPTVRDAGSVPMGTNFTWSFTIAAGAPAPTCPCTGWPDTTTPANPADNDPNPVEVGVKFTSDTAGVISGIRFYKSSLNTGPFQVSLWSSTGTRLATASVAGGSGTGWQTVSFATPAAIQANMLYVASYHTNSGFYAGDNNYFLNAGVDRAPIHFPRSGAVAGGNGVYAYGSASQFPNQTYQASNYWVDVVFNTAPSGPDTTPPTLQSTAPVNGTTDAPLNTQPSARFSEALDPATVNSTTVELRNGANQLVPAQVSYDAANATVRLLPSAALLPGTTYTATVRGGASDPRVKDPAGNALQSPAVWSFTTVANGPCVSPANPVVAENCLVGNPESEWDIVGSGSSNLQGFATQISVNRGETVGFKVDTDATAYRFDIYRMGYYGGMGARLVGTVNPSAALPQNQNPCITDGTGLIDCGNWGVSGSWAVPATATSGIYFAKLVRTDGTSGSSHIFFIVRNDSGAADLVFQTSDTTWQAYNNYGGNSLYEGNPVGRAYKVSYNRPFNTREVANGQDWVFNAEYPMVRWLESNGYNVTYVTGVDVERIGVDRPTNLLTARRAYMSVGHDEYWSAGQRANVEAARNAGTHLSFFSGNEVFWKTRWENSIDGSGTSYRTLVCYKETHPTGIDDPTSAWTGTWRDPAGASGGGGRPENALTGTLFMVNDGATTAIQVPAADGKMRLWRNTSVANLAPNTVATLANNTLGYEWDADVDNTVRPPGLFRMGTRTDTNTQVLQDQGSTYGNGTVTHALTFYKHSSGARVFSVGSVQWAWGLDSNHDRGSAAADVRMQQATVNQLADMGAQPATLQSGLVPATATSDAVPASSAITSPTTGATPPLNTAVTITGTASDTGGGVVGGVEVSVDNGVTWRRATGRESWSLSWTPTVAGTAVIRSRAVDDSGNLESPSAGVTVNPGGTTVDTTPPTVTTVVPAANATGVAATATVSATFNEAMTASTIGASTFELRTAGGALVTASVAYNATTRVATLTPSQPLSGGQAYTATVRGGTTDPRVKDLAGNALATSRVWSFTVEATAPTVTTIVPASNATGVAANSTVRATFSEAMTVSTINGSTFELRDNTGGGVLVAATVTYDTATRVATLTPSQLLLAGRNYTATVRGGTTDPRVKDLAGNALATDRVWSFTVDSTPPTVTAITPSSGAVLVARGTDVTATFSEAMDPATISGSTVELRSSSGALVSAVVSYSATNRRVTLNPNSNLAALTTYTVTVRGGATDPRVKDVSGNALATNRTWSFSTR